MLEPCSSVIRSMLPRITSSARVLIAWMTRIRYSQSHSNLSSIASRLCLELDQSAPCCPAKNSA
ncbi:hypothetical protein EMCG_06121 [[Emmonsia] crescens]|uniref:Uncharacterized protein n=1 Tax=[Emmonsia] crescens TaxID=73230 RepID=A0A0G2JBV9_9EURO|nr:hypothetical protein EMCG_06121 [Emmonsia crescens UAMH 3008]